MKKILIIFTILAALGGAFGIYKSALPKDAATPLPIPSSTPTLLPSPTTQASTEHPGMKLYRNEQWGFEFWYPEGWEWKENIFGSPFSKFNLTVMKIDGKNTNQDDFINIVTPDFADRASRNNGGEEKLKTFKIIIDDVIATEYTFTFESLPTIYADVPLGEFRMLFEVEAVHEKEFNQILSTFRFLK